jgi:hypothetical protein
MKKQNRKKQYILLLCSILLFLGSSAQNVSPASLLMKYVKNISEFNKYFPQEKVYLHFDNTGYFRGETIWFKAYVVRTDKSSLLDLSHILYVELVTPGGDVIETKKFSIKDGMADGNMKLDSKVMESGFYEVRAYTRYMTNWDNECIFSRVFPIFNEPKKEGDYSKRVIAEHSYMKRLPNYRESSDTLPVRIKKLNARFYPEGGNLVQGLTSTVAFDISNEDGAHVTADVYVMNGNDTITVSKTEREGRGVLTYTPNGDEDKVLVKDKDGRHREFPLPTPQKSGYVMSVNTISSNNVMVMINSTPDLYGKAASLGLCHNGIMEAFVPVSTDANGVTQTFYKQEMEAGVNQLTLFDGEGNVCADRLVFIYPHDTISTITLTTSSSTISPYRKIDLTATALPNTTFSMSVRDVSTETNGYGQDVRVWMLLTSDLRGFIENPDYYFEKDDISHRHAADQLMMVQGWRRYEMPVMTGHRPFVKRQPLEDALYLDGRIHQVSRKYPAGKVSLNALLYNKLGNVMKGESVTDSVGNYVFRLPDCEGDWTMLLSTKKNDKLAKYNVGIDRHFSPQPRYISFAETKMIPVEKPNLCFSFEEDSDAEAVIPMNKRNHVLKEVKVKGHRIYDDARIAWESERRGAYRSNLYYDCVAAADEIADKGENMPDFLDWLSDRNPFFNDIKQMSFSTSGMNSRNLTNKTNSDGKEENASIAANKGEISNTSGTSIKMENISKIPENNIGLIDRIVSEPGYKNRPIVWIVNNQLQAISYFSGVFNLDEVINEVELNLEGMPNSLDEVKSVYISEDVNAFTPYILYSGLVGKNAVTIFVYTFHELTKNVKGLRRTHFEGFAKPETFKMNDYSQMPPEADYRRTLYWNPNVTTDSRGKANVEFYNNSSCRQMIISAEGITKDGIPLIYKK